MDYLQKDEKNELDLSMYGELEDSQKIDSRLNDLEKNW
jgi:hypothetical protein